MSAPEKRNAGSFPARKPVPLHSVVSSQMDGSSDPPEKLLSSTGYVSNTPVVKEATATHRPSSPEAAAREQLLAHSSSPASSHHAPNKPLPKRGFRRMLKNMGIWVVFRIVVALILLAASIGFLTWIWFGDREDSRWRELALGPDITVAVTVTTVFLRAAVLYLSWVTTCMMASVIVEQHGVPAEAMAEASITRLTGSIVSFVLQASSWKPSLFKILVPLQVIAAVISQLGSTLLFSDFDNALFPGFPQELGVTYNLDHDTDPETFRVSPPINFAASWQSSQPGSFETFAEYVKPHDKPQDDDNDAVDDTGPIWRAFLPLDVRDDRTNIMAYEGVGRAFDARTVCVRPDIDSVSFKYDSVGKFSAGRTHWVGTANISVDQIPDLFYPEMTRPDVSFECPARLETRGAPQAWMQCSPRPAGPDWPVPRRIPSLDPLFYNQSAIAALNDAFYEEGPFGSSPLINFQSSRTGSTHFLMDIGSEWDAIMTRNLVANANGGEPDEDTEMSGEIPLSIVTRETDGPWLVLQAEVSSNLTVPALTDSLLPEDQENQTITVPIRATYCMDVMTNSRAPIVYFNLTATRNSTVPEPFVLWNHTEFRFNTAELRKQLGVTADPSPPQDRGIFTLTEESFNHVIEHQVKPTDVAVFSEPDTSLMIRGNIIFCSDCINFEESGPSDLLWHNLFNDVLEETGSPALATQAVNTAAARMVYMRWLGSFTEGSQATVRTWVDASVPGRAVGYSIVMAVIGLQIALLVVVGSMFQNCRNTVFDDAWLVISQVASSPAKVAGLARESGVTDAKVKEIVREEGETASGLRRRWVTVRDGHFDAVPEGREKK